jgi:hypothetical protein
MNQKIRVGAESGAPSKRCSSATQLSKIHMKRNMKSVSVKNSINVKTEI